MTRVVCVGVGQMGDACDIELNNYVGLTATELSRL